MKYNLEKLRIDALDNDQCSHLVNYTLEKVNGLPPLPDRTTNALSEKYLPLLTQAYKAYFKALNQGSESLSTPEIAQGDKTRDGALSNFRKAVSLGKSSDVAAEVEAANACALILKRYKGIEAKDYGTETENIQKLIDELTAPAMSAHVETLGLTRHITRLKNANDSFFSLHKSRATAEDLKESFNTRVLRKEMQAAYKETCLFVQAMANANDGGHYAQVLALINGVRKQYSDLLARRDAKPEAAPSAN